MKINTSMGPAHVGPGIDHTPTLVNYETLLEAIESQAAWITRNVSGIQPGYATKFYLGDDDRRQYTYVGRVVVSRIAYDVNGAFPVLDWEYAPGVEFGPDADAAG